MKDKRRAVRLALAVLAWAPVVLTGATNLRAQLEGGAALRTPAALLVNWTSWALVMLLWVGGVRWVGRRIIGPRQAEPAGRGWRRWIGYYLLFAGGGVGPYYAKQHCGASGPMTLREAIPLIGPLLLFVPIGLLLVSWGRKPGMSKLEALGRGILIAAATFAAARSLPCR